MILTFHENPGKNKLNFYPDLSLILKSKYFIYPEQGKLKPHLNYV